MGGGGGVGKKIGLREAELERVGDRKKQGGRMGVRERKGARKIAGRRRR